MFNPGIIQRDSSGRLVVIDAGMAYFNGGTPVTEAGELLIAESGGIVIHNGLLFTAAGYVVVEDGGVIVSHVGEAFGMTVDQKLCVANDGTPYVWLGAIPFDVDGRICVTGMGPPPVVDNGILQETGDYILQEDTSYILQES